MQVSAMVFACGFHAYRAKLLGAIFLHTVKFLVPKFVTVAAQQHECEDLIKRSLQGERREETFPDLCTEIK